MEQVTAFSRTTIDISCQLQSTARISATRKSESALSIPAKMQLQEKVRTLALVALMGMAYSVPVANRNGLVNEDAPRVTGIQTANPPNPAPKTRSLQIVAFNFSSTAKGLQLILRGKQLNKRNLKLTTSDALYIAGLLHGQTLAERMYVWGKTAELCLKSGKKNVHNYTTFDVEVIDKFEGDIILDPHDIDRIAEDVVPSTPLSTSGVDGKLGLRREEVVNSKGRSGRVKRKMTSVVTEYWSGEIPWKIDDSRFSTTEVEIIKSAISHWEDMTCIRFRDITDPSMTSSLAMSPPSTKRLSKPYLGFPHGQLARDFTSTSGPIHIPHLQFRRENGCYSYTGKRGDNGQVISVGPSCSKLGIVAHEIGHAIGFYHEHNRPDRDQYIAINYDNIPADHSENFRLIGWDKILTNGIPYDYSSLMHYGGTEWSPSGSEITISAKDPQMQKTMGQRERLSFLDTKLVNFQFCSLACLGQPSLEWTECLDGGYRDPNSCDRCICPQGLTGPRCGEVEGAKNALCGEKSLTAELEKRTLNSPTFETSTMNTDVTCAWRIKAPAKSRIHLNIEEKFDIGYEQHSCEEYVEVRYRGVNSTGVRFCSTNISTHEIVSYDNDVLVLYRSSPGRVEDSSARWFRLTYSLQEGCGGCTEDQTAPRLPVCTRQELYDCSTEVSYDCGHGTCTETRKNFCYRDVDYCCPPYELQDGVCQLIEFRAVASNIEIWGPWSNWSSCSGTCGGCGWRSRERECLRDRCRGHGIEWERCSMTLCPVTPPSSTPALCKVEEIELCPTHIGFRQCLKTRYEPCPENYHTQRCCGEFEPDLDKGECVPKPTTPQSTTTSVQ